jgi:hypothetical protein
MSSLSQDSTVRQQRLQRLALRRGITMTKAKGEEVWFVYDRLHRSTAATVCYSLDEAEDFLSEPEPVPAR